MDKTYNFNWLAEDIDASIILVLQDGKTELGSYLVKELKTLNPDGNLVKFAVIKDLKDFIDYTIVRFANSRDEESIIDIPIKKLKLLYDKKDSIYLSELDALGVYKEVISKGYAVYPYVVNEPSEDLKEVMNIASSYDELDMGKKIDVLEELNIINYQRNSTMTK